MESSRGIRFAGFNHIADDVVPVQIRVFGELPLGELVPLHVLNGHDVLFVEEIPDLEEELGLTASQQFEVLADDQVGLRRGGIALVVDGGILTLCTGGIRQPAPVRNLSVGPPTAQHKAHIHRNPIVQRNLKRVALIPV